MEDMKIKAFEKLIVDSCNNTPISNREKYYVLKDIADKLLEVSERDIAIQMAILDQQKQNEQKGGAE